MATIAAAPPYTEAKPIPSTTGVWSWLTTVDHKRIGALYLITGLFFFVFGGLEAAVLRAQLATPNGKLLSADMYNQLFTMHGTTMIFLAVMPLSAAFSICPGLPPITAANPAAAMEQATPTSPWQPTSAPEMEAFSL